MNKDKEIEKLIVELEIGQLSQRDIINRLHKIKSLPHNTEVKVVAIEFDKWKLEKGFYYEPKDWRYYNNDYNNPNSEYYHKTYDNTDLFDIYTNEVNNG